MYEEEFGIELQKYFKFNSSHFVIYKNFQEPLHGHNYKVSLELKSKKLDIEYLIVDFDKLKPIASEVVGNLHHALLIPKFNKDIKIEEENNNINIT